MKKLLILLFFVVGVLFVINIPTVRAQAECDDCGYCIGRDAPGNWDECRKCIYDKTTGPATNNQTLEIKPNSDTKILEQITKTPGKYYTQLGCIDTGVTSFSDPSAPGGVLNFLLTKLIFPIVGALSFLSLIYGAFLLMTAQGSPEQIGKGRSYIIGAIVGLIFTLSAILIVNIIAGDILKIPGFSRSPQAEIQVRASVATLNGKTVQPILGVSYNGTEVQELKLNNGNQNIKVNIPVAAADLVKTEVLNNIIFTMKNDECFTITHGDRSTCCDCIVNETEMSDIKKQGCQKNPLSATKKAQCLDQTNYSGDVNLYISEIIINGKKCTGYTINGSPTFSKPIGINSRDTSVRCSTVET